MTFTANGKNETFPVSSQLCVQWSEIETDSAQSSSNKCKTYLLKIYDQHINFLNTI